MQRVIINFYSISGDEPMQVYSTYYYTEIWKDLLININQIP